MTVVSSAKEKASQACPSAAALDDSEPGSKLNLVPRCYSRLRVDPLHSGLVSLCASDLRSHTRACRAFAVGFQVRRSATACRSLTPVDVQNPFFAMFGC